MAINFGNFQIKTDKLANISINWNSVMKMFEMPLTPKALIEIITENYSNAIN